MHTLAQLRKQLASSEDITFQWMEADRFYDNKLYPLFKEMDTNDRWQMLVRKGFIPDDVPYHQATDSEFQRVTLLGICLGGINSLGAGGADKKRSFKQFRDLIRDSAFESSTSESITIKGKDGLLGELLLGRGNQFLLNTFKYSKVKSLVIVGENDHLNDQHLELLDQIQFLFSDAHLDTLGLDGFSFRSWSDDEIIRLCSSIKASNLTSLRLSSCDIDSLIVKKRVIALEAIADMIINTTLKQLDLSRSLYLVFNPDKQLFSQIITAIMKSKLEILNWDANISANLNSELYPVYLQLFTHPTLRKFIEGSEYSYRYTNINFQSMCDAIAKSNLKTLELYTENLHGLPESLWQLLMDAVTASQKLEYIIGLPDDAPQALLTALKSNHGSNSAQRIHATDAHQDEINRTVLESKDQYQAFSRKIGNAVKFAITNQAINLAGLRLFIAEQNHPTFAKLEELDLIRFGLCSLNPEIRRVTLVALCIATMEHYKIIHLRDPHKLIFAGNDQADLEIQEDFFQTMAENKNKIAIFLKTLLASSAVDLNLFIHYGAYSKIISTENCGHFSILEGKRIKALVIYDAKFEDDRLFAELVTALSKSHINKLVIHKCEFLLRNQKIESFFKAISKPQLAKLFIWQTEWFYLEGDAWNHFCSMLANSVITQLELGTSFHNLKPDQLLLLYKSLAKSRVKIFEPGSGHFDVRGLYELSSVVRNNFRLINIDNKNWILPAYLSNILHRNQNLIMACDLSDKISDFKLLQNAADASILTEKNQIQIDQLYADVNSFIGTWPETQSKGVAQMGLSIVYKALISLLEKLNDNDDYVVQAKNLLALIPSDFNGVCNLYFEYFNHEYASCVDDGYLPTKAFWSAIEYCMDANNKVIPFSSDKQSVIDGLLPEACGLRTLTFTHLTMERRILLIRKLLLNHILVRLNEYATNNDIRQQKASGFINRITTLPIVNINNIDDVDIQAQYHHLCNSALRVIDEIGLSDHSAGIAVQLIQHWEQVKTQYAAFNLWKSRYQKQNDIHSLLQGLTLCLNESGMFVVNNSITLQDWDNLLLSHLKLSPCTQPLSDETRCVLLRMLFLQSSSPGATKSSRSLTFFSEALSSIQDVINEKDAINDEFENKMDGAMLDDIWYKFTGILGLPGVVAAKNTHSVPRIK